MQDFNKVRAKNANHMLGLFKKFQKVFHQRIGILKMIIRRARPKEIEGEFNLEDPVAGGENGVKDLARPPITTGDPNNDSTERTNS